MKNYLLLNLLIVFLFLSCNKDDSGNNNPSTSLYSGSWKGVTSQNREIEIEVEKISGIEKVKKYNIEVEFVKGSSKSILTFYYALSDGITNINNSYFKIFTTGGDSTQYIEGIWTSNSQLNGTFRIGTKFFSDTFYTYTTGTYTANKR